MAGVRGVHELGTSRNGSLGDSDPASEYVYEGGEEVEASGWWLYPLACKECMGCCRAGDGAGLLIGSARSPRAEKEENSSRDE